MGIFDKIIQLHKKEEKEKQKIYWDVDDVVLNTTETIVDLINNKYRLPNNLECKSMSDCKDWGYKSLWRGMTKQQQMELFEGSDFWEAVKIKPQFYELVKTGILDEYDNIFITKGTVYNLFKKKEYLYEQCDLKEAFNKFQYIGLTDEDEKSSINMSDGIQIDDNYYNLKDTNARLKILLKNYIDTDFNNSLGRIDTCDRLYYVNSLIEVLEILRFNLKEHL